jgi:hypothetical protein
MDLFYHHLHVYEIGLTEINTDRACNSVWVKCIQSFGGETSWKANKETGEKN